MKPVKILLSFDSLLACFIDYGARNDKIYFLARVQVALVHERRHPDFLKNWRKSG